MRVFLLLVMLLLLSSCSNKDSQNVKEYDVIKLYKYEGRPWDDDATHNKLYNGFFSDISLYSDMERLNYSFIDSFKPTSKIDTLLFQKIDIKTQETPECPTGFDSILLLCKGSKYKYVVAFNDYCDEFFIYDFHTKQKKHKREVTLEDIISATSYND